jgi:heme exporter protein A
MTAPPDGLRIESVHVWRGERHVLKAVSLHLRTGELLQVSGANGAGKTTLLRVACGLLRPEQGEVFWQGAPVSTVRAQFQATLAYASHEPALKGDLTALENLRFAVGLKRRVSPDELRGALSTTGAIACADLPARVLSAGQRRRVAMARILAIRASLWILDEPYTNLDASGTALMSQLLRSHVEAGGAALVVAHHELQCGCPTRRMELTP